MPVATFEPRADRGSLIADGPAEVVVFRVGNGFNDRLRRIALAHGTRPSTLARALVERGLAELATEQPAGSS
jgi:hypothetical protein